MKLFKGFFNSIIYNEFVSGALPEKDAESADGFGICQNACNVVIITIAALCIVIDLLAVDALCIVIGLLTFAAFCFLIIFLFFPFH